MIFNSIEFAVFFPIVFFLYWAIGGKQVKARNLFIIGASYFFYGMWNWAFLSLIFVSSLVDFLVGIQLEKEPLEKKRKLWLACSVAVNIGLLAVFKYFNFFAQSFADVFTLFGQEFSYQRLSIILPVGISFYTFQTLSYTLTIYQKKMEPTKDALAFFAFVSFFPQLVAGPIERAKNLLPQFLSSKKPDYYEIRSGLLLMATGLAKKILVADRLAIFVDGVYGDIDGVYGLPMLVAAFFFALQLYLDFSAYSDIALGAAQTLGFKLSVNFKRPYLSHSFSDFWTRWHISLSTWFRDYVYIPLGGNRGGKTKTIRNVMVVFLVSGLWHGASWNFVIWGGINGLFLIILDGLLAKLNGFRPVKALFVTLLWTLSLVFFRAETLGDAMTAFSNLGFENGAQLFEFGLNRVEFSLVLVLIGIMVILEILKEYRLDFGEWILVQAWPLRYAFYGSLILSMLLLGSYGVGFGDNNFIYFQF